MVKAKLRPVGEQVVAVVGASSGIGREAAMRFARKGAKVVVSARSVPGLDSLVDEIRREGGQAVSQPADVAEFDQVKAVADRAATEFGRLDTWAHLAAVSVYGPFDQLTPEEFKRVVDVNLMAQVHGAMAALPHLKQQGGGALVHVTSMLARRSFPLQSPYCASKHGVEGFLESLRVELAHEGVPIAVANILPGTINTPLFDKARTKVGVRPTGPPPVYEAGVVADAILFAAGHDVRDVVVGGAAQQQLLVQRLSPRLMDVFAALGGFATQRTDEPRPADAPDNLFAPIPGHDTVRGHFGAARSTSAWTRLEMLRQPVFEAVADAVGGAAASLGRRLARD